VKYLIFASAVVGAMLLYLLSSASANSDLFSRNYDSLLAVAGVLAASLLILVGYQLWKLRGKITAQVFGAKLALRLTLFFALVAVLPGLLVYAVSVQFLSKSIESWFDVRVEKALEGGLNLGRTALETGLDDLGRTGLVIAHTLARQAPEQQPGMLPQLVRNKVVENVALFAQDGELLAYVNDGKSESPRQLDRAMRVEATENSWTGRIDTLPDNRPVLYALVRIPAQPGGETRYLQFVQQVPEKLSTDAETVQAVFSDYQQLSLSRLGLKRLYAITLTLSLLIVLLSAVSIAFVISERLSAPLAALAEGTRAVAQGDFSRRQPVQSRDELGALTGLFNQMTAQLADAKAMSERQQVQVESARAYLESVLAHLSSGVMVVDEDFRVRTANASAVDILESPLADMEGEPLLQIAIDHPRLRPFCAAVVQAFEESPDGEWQRQIERISKNGNQMLLVRGTQLKTSSGNGYVVVFDDISYLLQAERQAAWGEVARRLAHEIRNPLTPIQLSAERLEARLVDRLQGDDAQLLQRATQTIVSQVAALKNMVKEFSDYARAPAPQLATLDMHQLLREVLGLYEGNSIPVTLRAEAGETQVLGDATRLRQVIHNLLQNAQDELAGAEHPELAVITSNEDGALCLRVRDNGRGFPEHMLVRAFEPYVTTKSKGTGLGLAIVKKIVEEHGGSIAIENLTQGGTQVSVVLPLLTEIA
jgi:nitrogen fixation/metabolism regulation signal transduction histidine kinase